MILPMDRKIEPLSRIFASTESIRRQNPILYLSGIMNFLKSEILFFQSSRPGPPVAIG